MIQNVDDARLRHVLNVAKAGINRFDSEGYVTWPKEQFGKLLRTEVEPDDPCVQSALIAWESIGAIRLIGDDDCYIEVLGRIPN